MSRTLLRVCDVNCGEARVFQLILIVVFSLQFTVSPANCDETDEHLVVTTLSLTTSSTTPTETTATAAAAADDTDEDDRQTFRLVISPEPSDVGQVFRAVGSSVVFTCRRLIIANDSDQSESAAETATTVEWFDKNDIRITSQTAHGEMYTESITPSMTKLYISETHNKHAGPYTCAVLDSLHGHRVAHRTVTLLLYRDIEFGDMPGVVTAVLAGDVLLPCSVVHGQPPPVISWRFGRRRISSDDKYDIRRDGLYINNVTSSDEGDYFCQATVESSGMFREQRIQLKLLEGPTYSSSDRVTQLIGTESQLLTIACTAAGSPPISYEFFKDGRPVISTDGLTVNTSSGQLTIANVTVTDAGKYLCIASNVVGRMTAERLVQVHSKPVIAELQSVIESRGMTATLLCRSHGQPPPTLTFRRLQPPTNTTYRSSRLYEGGRVIVRDVIPGCSELIIRHVTVDDAGQYECRSANRVGADAQTANIDVGYRAVFLLGGGSLVVDGWTREGRQSRYNLTCVVDARPQPQLNWTHHQHQHQEQKLQEAVHSDDISFHVFHLNSSATVLQITLPPADSEANADSLFGLYTCHASNFFGQNYLTWQLRKAETPGKPRAVRVVRRLTTSIQLDVEPPSYAQGPPVTGFLVVNELKVNHVNLDEEIWLTGLRPSTVYLVSVAAVNAVGVGQSTLFAFTTDSLSGPSAVRSVSVQPGDQSSSDYMVSWQAPYSGGITIRSYVIRYRKVEAVSRSKSRWRPVERWTSALITAATGDTRQYYTVDQLAVSSYYQLDIRAINDLDWSPSLRPPFVFYTHPDRSASSSWSSEDASAVAVLTSGQRRDVAMTSLLLALAMTSLLCNNVAADIARLLSVTTSCQSQSTAALESVCTSGRAVGRARISIPASSTFYNQ